MEIDNDKSYDTKKLLEEMPKGNIEVKAGKLFFVDPYNTTIQNQHLDILRANGVKVKFSETDFVLTIETTGQLTAKEVLEAAADAATQKLEELEEAIKKL
jgi:hypothetical protein